jgi:hypothetical protein
MIFTNIVVGSLYLVFGNIKKILRLMGYLKGQTISLKEEDGGW